MKMIEISKEKFDEFASSNPYNNYCQTSNYGMIMAETGFEYSFVAYTDNDENILAAGMFLTKKIGKTYKYAYSPKGFLIDYDDSELVKRFTRNLIKYYTRKKIILLKINPEIPTATIDYKNDYNRIPTKNDNIVTLLKNLGFKRRKEINPLELLQPKLTALINLKEYDVNNLEYDIKNNINLSIDNGLELIVSDATKIEYLYEFIKNMEDKDINYYRNFYNAFNKTNQADLLLVRVNYETYLKNAKKRVEKEQIINDELNEKLRNDTNEINLNKKMESDRILEEYKQDIIYATAGLRRKEDTFIAGAIVIKYDKKISILISGFDKKHNYLNSNYFLHHKIIEKYKEDYEILDMNGIANDFDENSKYTELNKFKISFNPTITEYIGELDLIISKWRFKLVEKNNLLSSEFTKKNDTKKY